jgi:lauroyl/myristoyl acyltransferase
MRSNPCVRMGVGAAFIFVRRLERAFSPCALRRLLAPFIAARVAVKRNHPSLPLPECLGGGSFQITKRQRRKNYLNTTLEFFPEQLGTAKWQERLQIAGIEHIEIARREKRPVILAFCHFGPFFLLRYWLRAAGFPAANLVAGESQNRSLMKQLQDRISPFPETTTAFHREDQLRTAIKFVATGNPLLIALDVSNGKKTDVPVDQHCQFGMANGAIRMAMLSGAELIPCSIVEVGAWRFQIRLGPPVPPPLLASGEPLLAGKHLLAAMLPVLRKYPEQCTERLVKQFGPINSKNKSYEAVAIGQLTAR